MAIRNKAKSFIFLISLFVVLLQNTNAQSNEKMEYTLNLLKLGEEKIQLGHENIFLILGNTGSGKSTLAQLMAGNNDKLISKEVGNDTGEFIIVDSEDKISNNSTLISKTLFPDLVFDSQSNTAFYDCPGFSDTRNSSIDISSSYFIHRVITSAKSLKAVFVINYSSVKEGVDRSDFLTIMKHGATLFKDFSKYEGAISVVISKVDNIYAKVGKELVLVSDEKIIANIASFMGNAKSSLQDFMNKENDNSKKSLYKNAIKLIEFFLIKNNNNYLNLALFRRPDEPGPLSKILLMQEGKSKLKKMFNSTLKYMPISSQDFGFTISEESKTDVVSLNNQIGEDIHKLMTKIADKARNAFTIQETEFTDISDLKNNFKYATDVLKDMTAKLGSVSKPQELFQIIKTFIQETLKIQIEDENSSQFLRYDKFLEFLNLVTNKALNPKSSEWIKSFESLIQYLETSHSYFGFLIDFYIKLSDWSIHRDRSIFNLNKFKDDISNLWKNNVKVIGEHMKPFLEGIFYEEIKQGYNIRGFDTISNTEINPPKFNIMIEMLEQALNYGTSVTCENNNVLVARGDYIKLSEVINKPLCPQKITRYELYGLQKIFIDQDFNEMGQNMQILLVAPVWEIIDGKQINLSGDNAAQIPDQKAPDGGPGASGGIQGAAGNPGQDGRPGYRGHSGGSFFGVYNRAANGQNVVIKSIGSSGSAGQHGGNGGNGENGRDVDWVVTGTWKKRVYKNIFQKKRFCEQKGGLGGTGGIGGNGGRGGLPGVASEVHILPLAEGPSISIQQINGQDGPNGNGGAGGIGGTSGNQCTGTHKGTGEENHDYGNWWWEDVQCSTIKSPDGTIGNPGINSNGLEGQEGPVTTYGKKQFLENYKNLLNSNINNRIKRNTLIQFLNILKDNPVINSLP